MWKLILYLFFFILITKKVLRDTSVQPTIPSKLYPRIQTQISKYFSTCISFSIYMKNMKINSPTHGKATILSVLSKLKFPFLFLFSLSFYLLTLITFKR